MIVNTFCGIVGTFPAQADTMTASSVRGTAPGHVTIIVLDMSGSMGQNDPNGLRCSAANAYIDLSGLNDFIGVIGLDNNNGNTSGVHNFQTAQVWAQPTSTATIAERQSLQKTIAAKSSSCRPDNATPTYDALNKALAMLASATQRKQISGSVILLTDGVPYPDTTGQIEAIKADLIPQFKDHNWPIDTIALGINDQIPGTNTSFHDFLSSLSDATSGRFYDDGNGAVPGVSPLNIAPFFVDIFARRVGRTATHDIPPTQLDGGTTSRNFFVNDYTKSLDVVVVKNQPGATVSLVTPNGQQISQSSGGIFVSSSDPHYVIFSIDQPQSGQWELRVSGSGQFLMDSLKLSGVGVSIADIVLAGSTISAQSALPLGQPLTVTSFLTNNGQPVTDNRFIINGTISYRGASGQYSQGFALDDRVTPGTYLGNVTVPLSAPAGSYDIQIDATGASATDVVSSQTKSVRLELFPQPFFLSPQTKQPTDTAVDAIAVQWPWPLQLLYSLPVIDHFSAWPLQNFPAQPYTNIPGELQVRGKPYVGASVIAVAKAIGSKNTLPVSIIDDGQGHFHAQFFAPTSDTYTITFQTSGSFNDSHGDFGVTTRTVHVTVSPSSIGQVFYASTMTLFYLFCLLFIYYLCRFFITPRPFGEWRRSHEGEFAGGMRFSRVHRGPFQWFFSRNLLSSQQVGMPRGLQFRFLHGGGIEARADGPGTADWHYSDGSELRPEFQRVSELIFRPQEAGDADDEFEASVYTIISRQSRTFDYRDEDDEYGERSRHQKKKPAYASYDDDDDDISTRRRKQPRRKQSRDLEWDDDYE